MYKQVIVVRTDLKLSKGKIAAQAGHAVLDSFLKQNDKKLAQKWLAEGGKKVVLGVAGKAALLKVKDEADRLGMVNSLITDAGHTEIPPGTMTCLGIGPELEEKIDKVTGKLEAL